MCIYIYVLCLYFQVAYDLVVTELDCQEGHGVMRKCVWYQALNGKDIFLHLNKKNK